MAKKKTKKKAKKTKKAKKVIQRFPMRPRNPLASLHKKKLEILRAVPIMPCSAIGKDRQGLRYAHTQAEKVFQVYRRESESRGLVIRLVEGEAVNAKRPGEVKVGDQWQTKNVPCVRFNGKWEICDTATGQKETFKGSGDGDNEIWSNNSAQTIAFKQGLLMYFFTAWPQPTDWCKVIRKSLEEAGTEEFVKAMKMIIPEKIAKATGIIDMLDAFYSKPIKERKN
ncbi:hypothetical protein LCGC14_2085400 [marine sediment metagenome]|uniref:Uncharacterized protein n=1 Tax=marine sediment metagenome TaxID=412755 RepID=A0A0F9EEK9_9ZZZZ